MKMSRYCSCPLKISYYFGFDNKLGRNIRVGSVLGKLLKILK